MRWNHSAWTLLALSLVAGCSSSEPAEVGETTDQLSGALASTLPVVAEFDKPGKSAAKNDELVTPFEENLDFFSPPKMVIPIEPDEPEEDLGGELPPLRLVGFVGDAGDKALVAVDGKTHMVTSGKQLNGVEIVNVKSPDVELRWGETKLTLNFYKPSKTDRAQPRQMPSMPFSPGLSNVGQRPNRPNPLNAAAPQPAAPRPPISLPSLPGLPSAGSSTGSDLSDFPDLGAGPPAP